MNSDDAIYTVLYCFFSFIFIITPMELVSAGITAENMFGFCLGQEKSNFIMYHIKKTTLLRFLHTLVLPGYFVTMHCLSPSWDLLQLSRYDDIFKISLTISLAIPLAVGLQCLMWWKSDWYLHPIAVNMQKWNSGNTWRDIRDSVNFEFRVVDKFVRRMGGDLIVATENWVVKISNYNGWVVHQSDVKLEVKETDQHDLTDSPDTDVSVTQYLRLGVFSHSRRKLIFNLRILSSDFEELRMKILHPIEIDSNVTLIESVEERFLNELRRVMERNPKYNLPNDMEKDQCIGCMQQMSDVKLVKTCNESDCRSCFCRPMWCFSCIARWFASQQKQRGAEVSTWMSQHSSCPTCRSVFCVLDVCAIADGS